MRILFLLLLVCSLASAHELTFSVSQPAPGLVTVLAQYGHDEPANDSLIRVFPPGEGNEPFQSGQMDRNGLFVFAPDQPGEWFIAIDDELGHQTQETVTIDSQLAPLSPPSGGAGNTWRSMLTGVSLLIGVFGVMMWWTGRKKAAEAVRP